MKAWQISQQVLQAISSIGVSSTMNMKPSAAMRMGRMKMKMTTHFQSQIRQKEEGLMKMPTANERLTKLQKYPRCYSENISVMKVQQQLKEMFNPAPQMKTPTTAAVWLENRIIMRPIIPRMRLKTIVQRLPIHSVKKMAEKMPIIEPRMIELLSRVTYSDPSHRKSPNWLARLSRPSGEGVYCALKLAGSEQTCSLQRQMVRSH